MRSVLPISDSLWVSILSLGDIIIVMYYIFYGAIRCIFHLFFLKSFNRNSVKRISRRYGLDSPDVRGAEDGSAIWSYRQQWDPPFISESNSWNDNSGGKGWEDPWEGCLPRSRFTTPIVWLGSLMTSSSSSLSRKAHTFYHWTLRLFSNKNKPVKY